MVSHHRPSTPRSSADCDPGKANTKPGRFDDPLNGCCLSLASSTQFIFDGELQSLRFRQGSLNMNKGQNSGVWGRYLTNNTRIRANNNTAYRLQQDGIELGADTVLTTSGGRLITGGFVSYSDNMIKHARGGSKQYGQLQYWRLCDLFR
ncbi:autotransporter outer membrane beta-barrel domain-containing protein [Budvicia aquatica]|uniref:autotransporter outer membrane beta-barrel domain-containing protein n=1 Tax=Budvicia aquatica TaxID=82979 RepID=UPI0010690769|nr:autotransporter outer membrane beta-barrel domain-containing protein [Budvicia aquatica]